MNPNRVGWILIAAVIVAMTAIIAVRIDVGGGSPLNPLTNCPTDATERYPSTVVLIDRTDPITPSQKRYLTGFIEDLERSYALFEKVAVYPIDPSGAAVPLPLFERCNPGSPAEANVWFENPEQIRERFEADFAQPFNRALEESMAEATAEISPIMETLQSVMSNHSLDERITRQRIVLISDMLQNVPAYSHYRDDFDYRDFEGTAYSERTKGMLVGVGVTLVYLWRPNLSAVEVDRHIAFWERYFRDSGAVLERVYKVR